MFKSGNKFALFCGAVLFCANSSIGVEVSDYASLKNEINNSATAEIQIQSGF